MIYPWKVCRTYLEKWQPFIFYVLNNKFIPSSDQKYPHPSTNMFWNKSNNSYPKIGDFPPDKIIFPTVKMQLYDEIDYVKINLPAYIERVSKTIDIDYFDGNFNFHLITKQWDNNIEVGIGLYQGITDIIDIDLTSYVERYFKLIAFT